MLYPLFFEPIYKSALWGGRKLQNYFHRDIPEGKISESWEVTCNKWGISIVKNGDLKGFDIKTLIERYGIELVGTNFPLNEFPPLIKLIDANDKLSVQVHPNDSFAIANENSVGKTEMWYIIDARCGAQLVLGFKDGLDPDKLREEIYRGNLKEHLNLINVKPNDSFLIPPGGVHAILDGILLAEIQQNSNITYRLYDWDRVDSDGKCRELHIEKALKVIDFNFKGENLRPIDNSANNFNLVSCRYFKVDKIHVEGMYKGIANGLSAHIFIVLKGFGELKDNTSKYEIKSGDTFLIPASLGNYSIVGDLDLLETYL